MRQGAENYIAGVMGWFKGDSEFNINIVSVSSLSGSVRGNAQYIGNSTIKIEISSSAAASDSALEVARSILHEYIHADMKRLLYTKLALTTPNDLNFLETYNSYKTNGYEPHPEHETMAELYVDKMAKALEFFHKNELNADYVKYTNFFNEKPSSDFYRALAWQGLSNLDVQAWNKLSSSERTKLTNLQSRTGILTKSCE